MIDISNPPILNFKASLLVISPLEVERIKIEDFDDLSNSLRAFKDMKNFLAGVLPSLAALKKEVLL